MKQFWELGRKLETGEKNCHARACARIGETGEQKLRDLGRELETGEKMFGARACARLGETDKKHRELGRELETDEKIGSWVGNWKPIKQFRELGRELETEKNSGVGSGITAMGSGIGNRRKIRELGRELETGEFFFGSWVGNYGNWVGNWKPVKKSGVGSGIGNRWTNWGGGSGITGVGSGIGNW